MKLTLYSWTLILLTTCSKQPKLTNFSVTPCSEELSYDFIAYPSANLISASYNNQELNLDISFVESCGYTIDPAIRLTPKGDLFIAIDKEIHSTTREYLMCLCCYSVNLTVANIPESVVLDNVVRLELSTDTLVLCH